MSLQSYYKIVYSLSQYHGYSIKEVEDVYPFEREILVNMVQAFLEKQDKAMQQGRR